MNNGVFIKLITFFIALSLVLSGCHTVKEKRMHTEGATSREDVVVRFPSKKITAVAVVLHGLNLKPAGMDDWTTLLVNHGAVVLRPVLYGHDGDEKTMLDVSKDKWCYQFNKHMTQAKRLAKQHGVPLLFLGYSLGGLMGVEWLAHQENDRLFDKMVLLAPAISVPPYSTTALRMADFFKANFTVWSPGPKQYKAAMGSSVNAYRALLQIKSSLEQQKYRNANIKTLVITDKQDELISSTEIQTIISTNRLSAWQMDLVDNSFAKSTHGYRHLIMDSQAVGQTLWATMAQRVLSFYNL